MSEYIPFEIQIEIIKRLPAKSAVKFRLVSKPWNSYIGSSEFIIAHHHCNIHRYPHRLLAWCKDPIEIYDDRYATVFDDATFYQQDFTAKAPRLVKLLRDSRVIDCSFGLVCSYDYLETDIAILSNPLIKKSLVVPLPISSHTKVIGFGVCPVTLDPTIVNISHGDLLHSLPWEVEVFTLSSGTWKRLISSNLPRKTVNLQSSEQCTQVIIDGFIYWDACEREVVAKETHPRNVNLIVSFDMATHEFEVIDLPDILSHPFYMNLSKIRESLAVIEYIRYSMTDVCAVWMMKDIVTKSFTKLYTIKAPSPSSKMVLGSRRSGEPIMETHYEGEKAAILEVYEPCSEHITKLGIFGEDCSFFVSSYMETLFLLDQADCHIDYDSD
uniref:F-box protein CPR1-like n=1 Tax=Erigeron canadensis TaxID=72917 RepID=UPI001CB90F67|nr:F-box protein CPR1-like [Erigeron canadensis]